METESRENSTDLKMLLNKLLPNIFYNSFPNNKNGALVQKKKYL